MIGIWTTMSASVSAARVAAYAGLATFIYQFENCMTATALPVMFRDVAGLAGVVSLVPAAYLVGAMVAMVPAGRLAVRLGFPLMLAAALAVMVVGTLLCWSASGAMSLVAGRWITGFGGGALVSSAYGLVAVCAAPEARRGVLGWVSLGAGLGMVVGTPLGGYVADVFSWRTLFAVQVPVLAIAAGLMGRMSFGRGTESTTPLGWSRSLLFGLAATCACVAVALGREWGWLSGMILALLIAAGGIFAFVAVSERTAAAPLFPFAVWRSRVFWSFWGLLLACAMALGGTFLLVPFYLHDVVGLPVHVAAGWMIVQVVSYSLAAMTAARLQERMTTEIQALIGVLLVLAGAVLYATGLVAAGGLAGVAVGCALMGGGFGVLSPAVNAGCVARLPEEHRGVGAALLPLGANLGAMLGVLATAELKEWILHSDPTSSYELAFLTIIVPLVVAAVGFWYQRPKIFRA